MVGSGQAAPVGLPDPHLGNHNSMKITKKEAEDIYDELAEHKELN